MLGLLIVFVVSGIGFTAGYATRGVISRKRRAQYLAYEPYIAATRRPPLQSANLERAKADLERAKANLERAKKVAVIMNSEAARRAQDLSRSSEQVSAHETVRGNLRVVVDSDARPAAEPPIVDNLEELIRLLGQKK
jgi:hypothetical protein